MVLHTCWFRLGVEGITPRVCVVICQVGWGFSDGGGVKLGSSPDW